MRHPAYQLRRNKAIDRAILLEIIEKMAREVDLSRYTYIGLGGPFLDDIRLISNQFPELHYVSIERDQNTHKRQRFHSVCKTLRLVLGTTDAYLDHEFETDTLSIFWLDYLDLLPSNLEEFATVLDLVGCPSIVKVTVYCEFDLGLMEAATKLLGAEEAVKVKTAQIQEFQDRFDDYLDHVIVERDLDPSSFASVVQSMFAVVAQRTLPSQGNKVFQLVHSCRYADGPQMLTLTGIVCQANDRTRFRRLYARWKHANLDWHAPQHVDVPNLSVKERLALERHLPSANGTGKALQRSLGYSIDESQTASERRLRQYQDFYKYYPMFAKLRV